ncbi:multimeric flavodoxin WrbA [Anaerosolibacter carboniphilus]|uniref:Multimeric flavodoxin WrbA n=1 Tax=Anaerosolibacter carboniphilus TaxID=1417629 RepID=A0A841KZG8_9FIRM|nr:NAD(P)H-dependent oxidoreductase [Anaerosolibacter carboniphilus]MBB6218901.1 multimeric flavodoxin WrbA [Anaerosolibacter carboniphilus]
MSGAYVIMPGNSSDFLWKMVGASTEGRETVMIRDAKELPDLRNKKIIFAIALNGAGYNIQLFEILSALWERGEDALLGAQGAVMIHCEQELFTRSIAQNVIFTANQLGCRFQGHPLVEATGSLTNLRTWQKNLHKPLEEVCLELCRRLGTTLLEDEPIKIEKPKIVVLHASAHSTSNTLELWNMVKRYLQDQDIQELHVENGTIVDCKGCSYTTCKHFSKRNSCFYGGAIVQEILPAIEKADAVVWICPNYNDAVSAKLTAVINRMTVLYRRTKFYDKSMFAVIVSGNSGSDSVAKQLISALSVNKSFRLPPYFALMATANDPGEIEIVPGIQEQAKVFAENLLEEIKA